MVSVNATKQRHRCSEHLVRYSLVFRAIEREQKFGAVFAKCLSLRVKESALTPRKEVMPRVGPRGKDGAVLTEYIRNLRAVTEVVLR